jgi:hypothetical protein
MRAKQGRRAHGGGSDSALSPAGTRRRVGDDRWSPPIISCGAGARPMGWLGCAKVLSHRGRSWATAAAIAAGLKREKELSGLQLGY